MLLLALVIFAGYFLVYVLYARSLFAFPFDYDQGEGFELYDAIRLARGQGIYLDNAQFPFYSSNYPPVFRLMLAPLVALFGPHIWVGRALGFAASLACGALIFAAALRLWRRESGDEPSRALALMVAGLASLTFFSSNYVYWIGPLARAHLPMVMFSLAGIFFLDHAARRRDWVLGFVFLMLAGFTKLQAVDAIAAGFAYALIRNWRACVVALAACLGATALVVLGLNALTAGQFWVNVVLANVNEYDIARTWSFYAEWYRLHAALIWCAVTFVAWDFVRALRARSLKPVTIWSWWFLAAAVIVGMLTGKWGAGPTYLISAVAAACVCAAGLFGRVSRALVASRVVRDSHLAESLAAMALSLVLLVQATLTVHMPTSGRLLGAMSRIAGVPPGASSYAPYPYFDSVGYTQLGHLLDEADIAAGWELARIARDAPGPVWSEEAMISLNAGKDVVTNPTQLLNLSKGGQLDTRDMIDRVNGKEFGRVIFRAQFYPNDVLIAIGQNYQWCQTVRMNGFDYQVLSPRAN